MDVGDIATWVASVVAVAALISTGFGAALNRKSNQRELERRQAKQISTWWESRREEDGDHRQYVHIQNNSDALISNPQIYGRSGHLAHLDFRALSMRGEQEHISDKSLAFGVIHPGKRGVASWPNSGPVTPLVAFTDDAGKLWEFDVRERLLSAIQFPKLPGEPGKQLKRTLKESRKRERRAIKSRAQ